jgi:hypothetical protein
MQKYGKSLPEKEIKFFYRNGCVAEVSKKIKNGEIKE